MTLVPVLTSLVIAAIGVYEAVTLKSQLHILLAPDGTHSGTPVRVEPSLYLVALGGAVAALGSILAVRAYRAQRDDVSAMRTVSGPRLRPGRSAGGIPGRCRLCRGGRCGFDQR